MHRAGRAGALFLVVVAGVSSPRAGAGERASGLRPAARPAHTGQTVPEKSEQPEPGENAAPWPSLADVERTVEQALSRSSYKSNDLLTRDDGATILRELSTLGWEVAAREQVLGAMLPPDHLLVRELRTSAGRAFMDKVSALPGSFDRLDRLVRLPQGPQIFRDLVRKPGGEKLIEYMTTTRGGQNLGQQLSAAPLGADFNRPTGRIYTRAQLLTRLKSEYAAATPPRSVSTPRAAATGGTAGRSIASRQAAPAARRPSH